MYNGNSRFNDIGGGIVTEQIATRIVLNYDPATQKITAQFAGQPHFLIPQSDPPKYVLMKGSGVGDDEIGVDLSTRLFESFGTGIVDPVTGAAMDNITIAGIQLYIKKFYDAIHNEHWLASNLPEELPDES